MEKMQISVVGRETGQESDIEYSNRDQQFLVQQNFKPHFLKVEGTKIKAGIKLKRFFQIFNGFPSSS